MDRQIDIVELIIAFCNFGNTPKNLSVRPAVLSDNLECLIIEHPCGPMGARLKNFYSD